METAHSLREAAASGPGSAVILCIAGVRGRTKSMVVIAHNNENSQVRNEGLETTRTIQKAAHTRVPRKKASNSESSERHPSAHIEKKGA